MAAMAKKTKTTKKHRFKYAQPTTDTRGVSEASPQDGSTRVVATPSGSGTAGAGYEFGFVTRDLRRVGWYAGGLVLLEIGLWLLLSQTGVGDVIYSLIKV